jgi:hypothetical protein
MHCNCNKTTRIMTTADCNKRARIAIAMDCNKKAQITTTMEHTNCDCDGLRQNDINYDYDKINCIGNHVVKRSALVSSTTMAFKTKENRKKSFYFMFFFLSLLLLPKLLQRLFITWLQTQKHIRVHSLDANLKTHVQGNQAPFFLPKFRNSKLHNL